MSPKSKGGAPRRRARALPRGRHKLSLADVRASQRERVVHAMLDLVGRNGYAATSVPMVVSAARVSRSAYYELFPDKESCFLAACEEAAADVIATMQAFGVEADWVVGVRRGTRAWLQWWSARPLLARAWLVELPMAGEGAIRQREAAYGAFETLFTRLGRRIRRERPALPPLPEFVPRALVYALIELVAAEVRAGRARALTQIEDAAVYVAVKLLADDASAQATLGPRPAGAAS